MQSPLNTLLQKEMDRKDFLKHVAVGVVALTGASTIMKTLVPAFNGGQSFGQQAQQSASNFGYGASAYGGSANTAVSAPQYSR